MHVLRHDRFEWQVAVIKLSPVFKHQSYLSHWTGPADCSCDAAHLWRLFNVFLSFLIKLSDKQFFLLAHIDATVLFGLFEQHQTVFVEFIKLKYFRN